MAESDRETGGKEQQVLWVEQEGAILLSGVRCDRCGTLVVPPQHYGCEACGADETHLADVPVPSGGKISTFTTVYLHQALKTPYNVAEVLTEAGPVVRGRLESPDPQIGDPVVGSVEIIDDEPRFVFVPQSETRA